MPLFSSSFLHAPFFFLFFPSATMSATISVNYRPPCQPLCRPPQRRLNALWSVYIHKTDIDPGAPVGTQVTCMEHSAKIYETKNAIFQCTDALKIVAFQFHFARSFQLIFSLLWGVLWREIYDGSAALILLLDKKRTFRMSLKCCLM